MIRKWQKYIKCNFFGTVYVLNDIDFNSGFQRKMKYLYAKFHKSKDLPTIYARDHRMQTHLIIFLQPDSI